MKGDSVLHVLLFHLATFLLVGVLWMAFESAAGTLRKIRRR